MAASEEDYLSRQLITYIGNKRALLGFIGQGVDLVSERLGGRKLDSLDAFSGSGAVARYLRLRSSRLRVNDLERYAEIISRCYLSYPSPDRLEDIARGYRRVVSDWRDGKRRRGFISELYAPSDDQGILSGERVFYTARNALYLDSLRQAISGEEEWIQPYLIAPLLSEASIHANTSGVFKGFYKDRSTGLGRFGGSRGDALSRIMGDIELAMPTLFPADCHTEVHRLEAKEFALRCRGADLAYLDPPYNQHPYGSNYFMLNLIADYRKPSAISPISGIPRDWNRSDYNRPKAAEAALGELIDSLDCPFILVSFNSEGFISKEAMMSALGRRGRVQSLEREYNTFRASRNLNGRGEKGRGIHLKEYLFVLERS